MLLNSINHKHFLACALQQREKERERCGYLKRNSDFGEVLKTPFQSTNDHWSYFRWSCDERAKKLAWVILFGLIETNCVYVKAIVYLYLHAIPAHAIGWRICFSTIEIDFEANRSDIIGVCLYVSVCVCICVRWLANELMVSSYLSVRWNIIAPSETIRRCFFTLSLVQNHKKLHAPTKWANTHAMCGKNQIRSRKIPFTPRIGE